MCPGYTMTKHATTNATVRCSSPWDYRHKVNLMRSSPQSYSDEIYTSNIFGTCVSGPPSTIS